MRQLEPGEQWSERVEKLEAENERLQAHAKSMVDALNADIDTKAVEIERLRQIADGRSSALTQHRAEIERLQAREAQAKAIILAAGIYVPEHGGGWPHTWHRDADKWLGDGQ